MKKLAIIGASYLQEPIVKKARGCVISLWRTLFYVIYCIILEVS